MRTQANPIDSKEEIQSQLHTHTHTFVSLIMCIANEPAKCCNRRCQTFIRHNNLSLNVCNFVELINSWFNGSPNANLIQPEIKTNCRLWIWSQCDSCRIKCRKNCRSRTKIWSTRVAWIAKLCKLSSFDSIWFDVIKLDFNRNGDDEMLFYTLLRCGCWFYGDLKNSHLRWKWSRLIHVVYQNINLETSNHKSKREKTHLCFALSFRCFFLYLFRDRKAILCASRRSKINKTHTHRADAFWFWLS